MIVGDLPRWHRWLLVAAVALSAALGAPDAVRANGFPEPGARMYTLQWRDGPRQLPRGVGRLRALADGGVVFATGLRTRSAGRPRLWRLGLDGRIQSLAWAGTVIGHAAEARGTLLIVRRGQTTIERLDLTRHRRSTVVDLAGAPRLARAGFGGFAGLAALEDGSIAVTDGTTVWRVAPGGDIVRIRGLRLGPSAVVALAGGAFAVVDGGGRLVRVAPNGSLRRLVTQTEGGVASLGDGRILTTTDAGTPPRPALTIVDGRGRATRVEAVPARAFDTGDGGTLAETTWHAPTSMAVAADGSLVLATKTGRLRALVPAASPRPRVALAASTYASFEQEGRVDYHAAGTGTLTLEARMGTTVVARASGRTAGGDGALALTPLPPGRYALRLSLDTGTAVSEARGWIDTSTTLSIADGRAALTRAYRVDKDETEGEFAYWIDDCRRLTPVSVQCIVMYREYSWGYPSRGDFAAWWAAPAAIARATRGSDHVIRSERERIDPIPDPPVLDLDVPTLQRIGARPTIRARIASPAPAQAAASVLIRRPGTRRRLVGPVDVRSIGPAAPWNAELRLSGPDTATLRRWLRQTRPVIARVQVVLSAPAGPSEGRLRRTVGTRVVLAPR